MRCVKPDHDTGNFVPYSFRTLLWVLLCTLRIDMKDEGDSANGLTSPLNVARDDLNLDKVLGTASMTLITSTVVLSI